MAKLQNGDLWAKLRGDEDFKNMNATKIRHWVAVVVAEILGTAILVGLGCSAVHKEISGLPHLDVVLTFSFAIAVVVTTFGHISGSHVNPAISLASLMHGQISIPAYFLYVISQLIGATLGIASVRLISPDQCTFENFCVTLPGPDVGPVRAAICEAFMTAILTLVVCAAWDRRCQDKHDSMPIKFGLTIVALALPGAKYSGASINPARSFGPALLSGNFTHHWVCTTFNLIK
uniref:Aquaporin n=1 Tax=Clastoptera arizonana TaxID=38151 RepID=A0A1B6D9E9_9HEMI